MCNGQVLSPKIDKCPRECIGKSKNALVRNQYMNSIRYISKKKIKAAARELS